MSTAAEKKPWDDPVSLITPEVIAQYKRDGIVYLPQALHPEWLLLIELGMNRIMGDGGAEKHKFFRGQAGEFTETIRNMDTAPEIQRLAYDSPLADMMRVLLESDDIWYYSDEFFIKEGGNCKRTPWHQDTPYWPLAGNKIGSTWITLDPLPKEECLEFVRGSHLGPIYDGFDPAEVANDPTKPHYGMEFPPLPDIEAEREKWDIVSYNIQPGDIVLLHPSVLHGGGPTSTKSRRRTITMRFYGDDIVFAKRPPTKPTVPLTPGLGLKLKPGDPLRSPWYPRLRPVPAHLQSRY